MEREKKEKKKKKSKLKIMHLDSGNGVILRGETQNHVLYVDKKGQCYWVNTETGEFKEVDIALQEGWEPYAGERQIMDQCRTKLVIY